MAGLACSSFTYDLRECGANAILSSFKRVAGLALAIDLTALLSVTARTCRWLGRVLDLPLRRWSGRLDRFGWRSRAFRRRLPYCDGLRHWRVANGIRQQQSSTHDECRKDDGHRELSHVPDPRLKTAGEARRILSVCRHWVVAARDNEVAREMWALTTRELQCRARIRSHGRDASARTHCLERWRDAEIPTPTRRACGTHQAGSNRRIPGLGFTRGEDRCPMRASRTASVHHSWSWQFPDCSS